MPNGIELILADHVRVNELFDQFDATGDATFAGQILAALIAHDEAERGALYPMALVILGDADVIGHYEDAHATVRSLIEHAAGLEGASLVDAVAALRAAVTEHVDEEESGLLPAFDTAASPDQLSELATRLEQVKQRG